MDAVWRAARRLELRQVVQVAQHATGAKGRLFGRGRGEGREALERGVGAQ